MTDIEASSSHPRGFKVSDDELQRVSVSTARNGDGFPAFKGAGPALILVTSIEHQVLSRPIFANQQKDDLKFIDSFIIHYGQTIGVGRIM